MVRTVVGRGVLWSLLAAVGGCAPAAGRETAVASDLRATIFRVYESVRNGDELTYRQLVRLPPGDAYSDALTTTMFASIRLHQAVEKAFAGSSPASAPATRPSASLAPVDHRLNARAMSGAAAEWTFTVRGNRATIDQLAGRSGSPTLRRGPDQRWVLVPAPWDTPRGTATYELAVEQERSLGRALARARAAVAEGRAASVEEVNAILRDELAPPESLAGPTTGRSVFP